MPTRRLLLSAGAPTLRKRRHEFYVRFVVSQKAEEAAHNADAAAKAARVASKTAKEMLMKITKHGRHEAAQARADQASSAAQEAVDAADAARKAQDEALAAINLMHIDEAKLHLEKGLGYANAAQQAKDQAERLAELCSEHAPIAPKSTWSGLGGRRKT